MQNRDQQVSINIFEQINSICKEFRRGWNDGQRPRIEDALSRVGEDARSTLFANLLQLEIFIRQTMNECPVSPEYVKRFPSFSTQVRQAFNESSNMSLDGTPVVDSAEFVHPDQGTGSFDSLADRAAGYSMPNMLAARRIGDYELIRELGRGGMGVVYEAQHIKQGNQVALKTLPTGVDGQQVNAERLHKFRREFRSLSDINHPNLVGMQTLEVDGSQWFFTMDLIDGLDFLGYVRPSGELDEQRLRSALKQLTTGVIFLHECGIVHRDLKPSNVLVDATGCVKLLDFGLVAQLQQPSDLSANLSTVHFAGTPRYAAPEQMFGERTKATDWYALGTMTYEALTGVPPFTGRQMDVLKQKQTQDPPRLVDKPSIPVDLANLVDGLLKRDPEQRPTTAQIVSALQLNLETRSHGSTQDSHDSSDSSSDDHLDLESLPEEEIVLIGREQQLAQLETAKNEVLENRQPLIVWITGKSGEGKSSLCETFVRPLRQGTEMLVFAGRCYDRESVPFKAVDSIIESLVRYLRSSHGKWLKSEQPEDVEFLAQVFPLLRRVDWIAERKIQDLQRTEPQKIRGRAFYGLRQLLTAISQRSPIVIHIDDLQWGDADSARAWHELLNHTEAPQLMVLGSYRSDEVEDSPFLQTWNQLTRSASHRLEAREVLVQPLTEDDCVELAILRTGLPKEKIQQQIGQLYRDTDGNPYFLDQLLEGFDPARGEFRHAYLDEIVAGRLSRLPATALSLLEIVAISGQPIRVSEAARMANAESSALATLTHMRSERLVRLMEGGVEPMAETYHDKVRESLLAKMPPETKKRLHLQLAEEIERKQERKAEDWLASVREIPTPGEYKFDLPDRLLDLCQHFSAAKDRRAFIYQWLAGEQAMRAYAVEEAYDFFNQAKASLPTNESPTLMYRFWMGLGRVCLWHNSPDQATSAFQDAIVQSPGPFKSAETYAGLQAVNMQRGRYDEAIQWTERVLAELGIRRPKTTIGRMFSILEKNLRLFLIPPAWQRARKSGQRHSARLAQEILLRTFYAYCEKSPVVWLEAGTHCSLSGLKTGERPRISMAFASLGANWSSFGASWLGRWCLGRAYRFTTDIGDPELAGLLSSYCLHAEYWSGRLKAVETQFDKAFPLLTRCCQFEEIQTCLHMYRHVCAYIGDTQSELRNARAVLEVTTTTGNAQGMCWGSYDIASALARAGDIPEAMKYMAQANRGLTNERFEMTSAIRASTDGYVRLQCSDYDMARRLTEFAWSVIKKGWMAIDVTLLCVPILIESIAGPDWMAKLPVDDRRALKRVMRRGKLFYLLIPNQQAHLCRVSGRAYWRLGKQRKAVRQFKKAITLSEMKGMKYQQAKSLLDLAAVKEEGRDSNRTLAIKLLKKVKSVIPRAESWLLGDQYDESVVAPVFDLEAWEAKYGSVTPYLE